MYFSKSKPIEMKEKKQVKKDTDYQKGDTYEVTPEGSLGLLALGYQGLLKWREAKENAKDVRETRILNIDA